MNLNHVTLPARDLDASVAFYRTMGFEQIVEAPGYARFKALAGDATFSLHAVEAHAEPSAIVIYFECKALDARVQELSAAGIHFVQEPRDQPWRWREARLVDPAGNQICLYHAGENRLGKIFAITGSLRATSSSAALVRAVGRLVEGAELAIYDGLAGLPHFSPDLDVEPYPASVVALREAAVGATALVLCTPEYAHGMPGSLKNALDWLVSATGLIDKPVLLISASPGGAAHAHAQLSEVLRTMSLRLVDGGAHVFSRAKLDANGELDDAGILAALRDGVTRLRDITRGMP